MEYPAAWPLSLTGCAHYIREPGTDNSINFAFKKGLMGRPWLEVMTLSDLKVPASLIPSNSLLRMVRVAAREELHR